MTLGIIFLLILMSLGRVRSYMVAIVEYKPITDSHLSPEEILMKNAEEYIKILEDVSTRHNITLIFYPEATLDNAKNSKDLSSYATEIYPWDHDPICTQNSKYPAYLRKLGCAAKKYKTWMVINLIREAYEDYYTSDVVLSEDGKLNYSTRRERRLGLPALKGPTSTFTFLNRYTFDPVYDPRSTNKTDFYFKVTSFVRAFSFSDEIQFDFFDNYTKRFPCYLVSSNWISELPFLTSLQVLQMWAQADAYGSIMLMSGANNLEKGQGGTGIFAQNTPVVMDFSLDSRPKVHILNINSFNDYELVESPATAEKTIDELAREMDEFNLTVDPDLFRYESMVVDHDQTRIDQILCYNKTPENYFCCEFHLGLSFNNSLKKKNYYTYHLVAYRGYKTYHDIFEKGGIEVCAVIACLDRNLTSCGKRFKKYEEVYWPLTFQELIIKANFGTVREERLSSWGVYQFPNSLLSSIRPIDPKLTIWTSESVKDKDDSHVTTSTRTTFALKEPLSKILTFGIFGRNFTLGNPRSSSVSLNLISLLVVLSGLIIVLI